MTSTWRTKIQVIVSHSTGVLWALFLLCLPVTSFPFFPSGFGGGTLVRPLSLYPLLALLVLFTIPCILTKPLPKTFLSLLPFILIAVSSSLLSTLRGIDPLLGIKVDERILRALVTLVVGISFYLTVSLLPQSEEHLRRSLHWLYIGFALALFWGTLQSVYVIHFNPTYFRLLSKIQHFISVRRLFPTRISGLTYEPNWFAEQISALLWPWLLASLLTRTSAFRWRWRWLTVELFLLAWSSVVLAFTFSRAGMINLLVLSFLSLTVFRIRRIPAQSLLRSSSRLLLEAALVVLVLAGLSFVAGSRNNYFARIWQAWSETKITSPTDYLEYLGIGARLSYGEAAYRTYEQYPLLGVGLGNYAFYFEEMLPDRPLAMMPEVLNLLTPDPGQNRLVTPKNLYLRLLAETGLFGFAAFLAFLVAVLGCAVYLWRSSNHEEIYWGKAGILALVVFVLSAFSFDSFAIPNMWVVFGLVTAAARISSSKNEPNTIDGV